MLMSPLSFNIHLALHAVSITGHHLTADTFCMTLSFVKSYVMSSAYKKIILNQPVIN